MAAHCVINLCVCRCCKSAILCSHSELYMDGLDRFQTIQLFRGSYRKCLSGTRYQAQGTQPGGPTQVYGLCGHFVFFRNAAAQISLPPLRLLWVPWNTTSDTPAPYPALDTNVRYHRIGLLTAEKVSFFAFTSIDSLFTVMGFQLVYLWFIPDLLDFHGSPIWPFLIIFKYHLTFFYFYTSIVIVIFLCLERKVTLYTRAR